MVVHPGLCLTWLETLKTGLLVTGLIPIMLCLIYFVVFILLCLVISVVNSVENSKTTIKPPGYVFMSDGGLFLLFMNKNRTC